jgi:serine phosphatase RsbU (regulator of sigma subunit)/anti-sigma regulatory factor (Ser/Thr protein kinase)
MTPDHGANRPAALRLTLPCDLSAVRPAADEVASFLASLGCQMEDLTACGLALVEACNNAIKYASPTAQRLPIGIDVLVAHEAVEIRVIDHTDGFEWPQEIVLPAPDSESGRGLYLIHSLTDQAGYLRGQHENVLHFSRHRKQPGSVLSGPDPTPSALQAKLEDTEHLVAQLVEQLSSSYESLAAIFRHSPATHEAGELKPLAERLLADLLQIVHAEWYLLRLVSPDGTGLTVFAGLEAGLQLEHLSLQPDDAPLNSAEVEAALTRRQVWFDTRAPDAAIDPLARAWPAAQGLVHPFYVSEGLLGTLTVGRSATHINQSQTTVFTAGETNIIGTLADFLAIQVVNARFQEEQVVARVTAHELEIANSIQRSLLPRDLPQLPGIEIAAHCENARQVGGDFFDVLRVNDTAALMIIADVMGKGVPAAMFAAILRTALRAAPDLAAHPARLLAHANHLLFDDLSAVDMFITAQVTLIDAHSRTLTLANAGHCPLLLCANRSPGFAALSPEGMPLGIQRDAVFQEQTVDLGEKFRALLYTDGLTEAVSPAGERYGQDNLECWFGTNAWKCRSAEILKTTLAGEIQRFREPLPIHDDQTFLTLTNHSPL